LLYRYERQATATTGKSIKEFEISAIQRRI